MANFTSIKAKIVTKVKTLTDYFEADGSVFTYEPEIAEVVKDPCAVIVASGNENDFASTSENRRSFAFVIRIFMERKQRTPEVCESTLASLVDALINAFDQDYTLGGEVLISKAVPSRWGYILADKEYRTAEVIVQGVAWYDITA